MAKKVNWDEWLGFISFERTLVEAFLERIDHSIVAIFTGNQQGKTRVVCGNYIPKMIMGALPLKRFNIYPEDKIRSIRLASENLPNDSEGSEVRNTVYPALKESLPKSWIKKDITVRKPVVTVNSPIGGPTIPIEFVSYNMTTNAVAGVQRKMIVLDELSPYEFYEEQRPRIMAANGRIIITVTAINANWMYDELFERARTYVRTPIVVQAYKDRLGLDVKKIEHTDSSQDICVIQAATDDNPLWAELIKRNNLQVSVPDYITKYLDYNDPDTILMRRYGILKQSGGAIFKDFQWDVHYISGDRYFPNDIPYKWRHGRFVDFHEKNPWAIMWLALSPENEAFVWQEMNPSPEREIVSGIARQIAEKTGDIISFTDLIDPLAAKMQPSVGVDVTTDLNRCILKLKREGIGTGGYFRSWDTKSLRGRDEIKKRLKNAKEVGKPFNNKVVRDGRTEVLPTLWILDNCKQTALSLRNWRTDEWADRNAHVSKDAKETPQQKWSHFCMCLEACFKHPAFQSAPRMNHGPTREIPQARYGQRGGR